MRTIVPHDLESIKEDGEQMARQDQQHEHEQVQRVEEGEEVEAEMTCRTHGAAA